MKNTAEVGDIIRRENHLIYESRPQDLTEEDWDFLREQGVINGCGAKTGPFANFRPPCAEFFEANCDWHDHGYKKGGGFWRKFEVDYKFFRAQLRDIHRSSKPWWYRIYLYGWAVLYYLAVTIFGWSSYDLRLWEKKYIISQKYAYEIHHNPVRRIQKQNEYRKLYSARTCYRWGHKIQPRRGRKNVLHKTSKGMREMNYQYTQKFERATMPKLPVQPLLVLCGVRRCSFIVIIRVFDKYFETKIFAKNIDEAESIIENTIVNKEYQIMNIYKAKGVVII